jgi:hypothetical protein
MLWKVASELLDCGLLGGDALFDSFGGLLRTVQVRSYETIEGTPRGLAMSPHPIAIMGEVRIDVSRPRLLRPNIEVGTATSIGQMVTAIRFSSAAPALLAPVGHVVRRPGRKSGTAGFGCSLWRRPRRAAQSLRFTGERAASTTGSTIIRDSLDSISLRQCARTMRVLRVEIKPASGAPASMGRMPTM